MKEIKEMSRIEYLEYLNSELLIKTQDSNYILYLKQEIKRNEMIIEMEKNPSVKISESSLFLSNGKEIKGWSINFPANSYPRKNLCGYYDLHKSDSGVWRGYVRGNWRKLTAKAKTEIFDEFLNKNK